MPPLASASSRAGARRGAQLSRTAAAVLLTLQELQVHAREYQDDSDIYHQTQPQVVPQEQDVHADYDGYHREYVEHDGYLSSHRFVLLCAAE
jgi:hypothetical protein